MPKALWWKLALLAVVVAGTVAAMMALWPGATRPDRMDQRPAAQAARRDLPADIPVIPAERRTVVPEDVRAKWTGVRLTIQDRKSQSSREVIVGLGQTFTIPDSGLTVKVAEFLPDLMIAGAVFTTASNEPKNPAVRITVLEHGREVFTGWLSAAFPTIHPFQHERFAIFLKAGIERS